MNFPQPPQLAEALAHLHAAAKAIEGRDVEFETAEWPVIEKAVVKLLGGAFQGNRGDHLAVALGLAAAFAERLGRDLGAFWFPNRDALEGASLGFPDALIMLSPFGAVADALGRANLAQLDEVAHGLRQAVGEAKFGMQGGPAGAVKLTPDVYARLFDPGFVQLLTLDADKARAAWEATPEKLARDVRDALARAGREIPPELAKDFEAQLLGGLGRLRPGVALIDQPSDALRTVELFTHLFGTAHATGFAPEEFWVDLVLPLVHIGAPATFPPLGEEEVEAMRAGVDATSLFVDAVPFQESAAEEGLLGVFPAAEIRAPHEKLAANPGLRLLAVPRAPLEKVLRAFEPAKTKDAIARFAKVLEAKAGQAPRESREVGLMTDAALALLTDLRRVVLDSQPNAMLCVRRVTEAEAGSEQALGLLRKALSGPRLIVTL